MLWLAAVASSLRVAMAFAAMRARIRAVDASMYVAPSAKAVVRRKNRWRRQLVVGVVVNKCKQTFHAHTSSSVLPRCLQLCQIAMQQHRNARQPSRHEATIATIDADVAGSGSFHVRPDLISVALHVTPMPPICKQQRVKIDLWEVASESTHE
jgi:hypothetical protein